MGYIAIGFFVFAIVVVFFLTRANNPSAKATEESKEPELAERFRMGEYVEGLPGQNAPLPIVFCGITEKDFFFCKGSAGAEIGRIARNSLTNINISKQGDKICNLEINWGDANTAQQKAVFRFEDKQRAEAIANETAQELKKWQKGA